MNKKIVDVSLPSLELDQENARFENELVSNQREAIQYLLQIPGMSEKIAELANHIAINGFDPTELPLVISHPSKDKTMIVVEGNRRILALKLLQNPDLCPDNYKSLRKKISAALKNISAPLPETIQCSLVENRKAANLWIELKHTGENNGAGRVTWDGKATDAFREKATGIRTPGRAILDYINNDNEFDEDLKLYAKNIKITNLNRLFGTSEAQTRLGYKITGGKLLLQSNVADFRRALEAIIYRFKEDGIKVGDIYNAEERVRFFDTRIQSSALPSKDSFSSNYTPVDATEKTLPPLTSSTVISTTKRPKSNPPTNLRKHLINYTLRISHPRLNAIYNELRNKLNVHETPNAVSVTFRVFLELSTEYALIHLRLNSKNPISKDDILRKKVNAVIEKLLEKGKLERKEAEDIRHAANNEAFKPGTVDSIHRYVHGPNHPLATELNDIMDNWAPYLKAIWAYDQESKP